ncbi:hypothetical protein VTP01DRAFT_8839 [Rhizomucor pusillus]|uniref:uncharacterized protein n=1 Tax=Rhizomucor pusillus TaxID=4840 RepID=UPI003742E97F
MQRGGSPSPIRSIESPTRNLSDLSQSPVSRFHSDRLLGLSHSGSFGGNNAFMPSYKRERLPVLSFSDLMANDGSFRPSEKREDRLRYLMAEAQQNHLEGASIFYAEKVLALSNDNDDVYWLAKVYFQTKQYDRALNLLKTRQVLNQSVPCRYLAGLCANALEEWEDALDYLGTDNPFTDKGFYKQETEGPFKLEALMCNARGIAYLNLKETGKAKNCFREALKVDVRCYDALDALIQHNLLDEKAEWEFIMTLPYEEQCGQDAQFFRSLYMTELKRYSHIDDIDRATKTAEKELKLSNSLDVLQSKAATYAAQSDFQKCLEVCEEIRKQDALYTKSLPAYLTALYELRLKDKLYELAQELVTRLNDKAITWHAVGMYELYIGKYQEARKHFRLATELDQFCEYAWLGYGHSFAAENDHDQAISAYITCSKLIPGSHLPYMYIGVEYMKQKLLDLAYEHLQQSYAKCSTDPFLLNELGVYYYYTEEYNESLEHLRNALKLAKGRQNPRSILWPKLWLNLGNTHRELKDYDRALRCYRVALNKDPQNPDIHAAIGYIYHIQGKCIKAFMEYSKSARLQQNDTVAQLTDKVLLAALDSKAPVTPDDDDNIFSRYLDEDKLQSSQIDEEMLSIETEECNLVPEDMEDVDIQPDVSKDF